MISRVAFASSGPSLPPQGHREFLEHLSTHDAATVAPQLCD
jgi:hypothetical protein